MTGVAVITGASSGIGAATARALAAGGYLVALLARRADRIHALADELGDDAIAIEADVTDRDQIVAAADRVKNELGGADVLVNNAGVMLLAPFTSEQRTEQRQMVDSSVAGRVAGPGGAVYHATKWGLNGWSESLRQELQPDIRVIVIEPSSVDTELVSHITHEQTRESTAQFVEATAISAEDIAQVIAFAVSRPRNVSLSEILVRPTAQAM